ncbi:MAG TPA: ABC transporter ATP-binding protein [Gemmatimonadaceae bacterium]|jgi:heme exporter protein A
MTHVLEAERLTRVFARRRAVNDVTLQLEEAECLALFGPNGAGKTTLLRLFAGLLRPTSGSARVNGHLLRGDASTRSHVGFISHQSMLYAALSVRENVELTANLYGMPNIRGAADEAMREMRVMDRANAPVRALSRGLQQRVSIARALVHRPRVLLLDEPYTGLDALGAAALTEILMRLRADGATLVLVTHNISEGLAVASHAAVMHGGRLLRLERREVLDSESYAEAYRELVGGGR